MGNGLRPILDWVLFKLDVFVLPTDALLTGDNIFDVTTDKDNNGVLRERVADVSAGGRLDDVATIRRQELIQCGMVVLGCPFPANVVLVKIGEVQIVGQGMGHYSRSRTLWSRDDDVSAAPKLVNFC